MQSGQRLKIRGNNMSAFEVYLIMKANTLICIIMGITLFLFLMGIGIITFYALDEERTGNEPLLSKKSITMWTVAVVVLFLIGVIIPNTETLVSMKVVPMLTQKGEPANNEVREIYKLTKEYFIHKKEK
jgi:heme/copper-type cytochrome/quinol oxidase subunit 2